MTLTTQNTTPTTTVVDNTPPQPLKVPSVKRGRAELGGDLNDETIVARPLSTPEFGWCKPKDSKIMLRWINYTVPTKDGPSDLRLQQAMGQGYAKALPIDMASPVPTNFLRDNGQRIVWGDLMLMKIAVSAYRGALKYKDQQALRAVQRAGAVDSGKQAIAQAMAEINAAPKLARKLQPFSPTSEELTKDFGESGE